MDKKMKNGWFIGGIAFTLGVILICIIIFMPKKSNTATENQEQTYIINDVNSGSEMLVAPEEQYFIPTEEEN